MKVRRIDGQGLGVEPDAQLVARFKEAS